MRRIKLCDASRGYTHKAFYKFPFCLCARDEYTMSRKMCIESSRGGILLLNDFLIRKFLFSFVSTNEQLNWLISSEKICFSKLYINEFDKSYNLLRKDSTLLGIMMY